METLGGWALPPVGAVVALIGIFVPEGVSIERLGIILGGLGCYFGLRGQDRSVQVLGIAAGIPNVIAMFASDLEGSPQ